MNKKFLSAVLFGALIAGSSVTFTGCIDNDEPAGIENLRGAKAELLRAKVAVEAANAALINAQATETLARAKKEEAIALEKQYLAEKQKMENEIQAARDEEEKARLQAAIEETNAKLEQNKLAWEAELLTSKQKLAEAQKSYEDAMKALELSKEYLSESELAILENVQNQYNRTYANLYGGSYYVIIDKNKTTITVTELQSAKGKLDAEYKKYEGKVTDPENYMNEASLQEDLLKAQTDYEKVSGKLAIKQETLKALESGDAYTAWLALKAKYNEKLDSLKAVLADKNTKKAEIIASEANHSIKGLQATVTTMAGIIANKTEVAAKDGKDSTFTVSSAIQKNLTDIPAGGFVEYDQTKGIYTANFKTGTKVLALAKTNSNDDADKLEKATEYATLMDNTYGFADGNGSAYKTAVKNINDAITAVNDAKAAIDANEMAYAKEVQAAAKKAMDEQKKVADVAIKNWSDAVTAYNSGTSYTQQEFDEAKGGILVQLKAVKDGTVGYTTDAQIKSVYDKYISFRAVMTANGQKALPTMPSSITNATTFKSYLTSNNADSLLPDSYTKVDLAENLLTAAKAAFGTGAGIYDGKGVLVRPTDEAIKKVANFGSTCGAQGSYLAKVDAYNTATENVEKVAQFDKVIAQLTAWKNSLAAAKTAYVAKYQANIDAVIAAQKSVTENVVNPIAELKIGVAEDMKDDIDGIISSITNKNPEISEFETLIAGLKKEIDGDPSVKDSGLKADVKAAEGNVLKAEKMIELFKAGNLKEQHVLESAEASLAAVKAVYEQAVVEFNYWSGKLEDTTKALYGKASAE